MYFNTLKPKHSAVTELKIIGLNQTCCTIGNKILGTIGLEVSKISDEIKNNIYLSKVYLSDSISEEIFSLINKTDNLLLICQSDADIEHAAQHKQVFGIIDVRNHISLNLKILESAIKDTILKFDFEDVSFDLEKMTEIGTLLTAENDFDKLLDLILSKTRELLNIDAGSIYLLEDEGKTLRFKTAQNFSLDAYHYNEFTIPANRESIAGTAVLDNRVININDVYDIPDNAEFQFNKTFDERESYRTKSMLTVPMTDRNNQVIGVLQLINKKYRNNIKLTTDDTTVEREITTFTTRDEKRARAIANQAGISIEKKLLYDGIERLFDDFIKASVIAIESRDPTTSGHSYRVSLTTVRLAEALDMSVTGKYANTYFGEPQIKEIRYASLLHDFGKIGVKEQILVKAKKLYSGQMDLIKSRFNEVKNLISYKHLLDYAKSNHINSNKTLEEIEHQLQEQLYVLNEYLDIVNKANQPSVLAGEVSQKIDEIACWTYFDGEGEERRLLTREEVLMLKIPKGTLDEEERLEIESHVEHSYKFLKRIPWPKNLELVPEIAYGHHEKLNGNGYPRGLTNDQILLQSKIITICDIYDALTASDRPYKSAVPLEKALDILGYEAKDGNICSDMLKLFIDAKVYDIVTLID